MVRGAKQIFLALWKLFRSEVGEKGGHKRRYDQELEGIWGKEVEREWVKPRSLAQELGEGERISEAADNSTAFFSLKAENSV